MAPRDLYVGIGSNIEPSRHVPAILDALLDLAPTIVVSPVAVTEPIGIPQAGGDFWNLAARLSTDAPEADVKQRFNAIERRLGRDRDDPHRKHRPVHGIVALDRGTDGDRAQARCRQRCQCAEVRSDGGAGGADDEDRGHMVGHGEAPLFWGLVRLTRFERAGHPSEGVWTWDLSPEGER